jgi:hypothetical protein
VCVIYSRLKSTGGCVKGSSLCKTQFGWFARWYSMYDDLMLKGGVDDFLLCSSTEQSARRRRQRPGIRMNELRERESLV